MLIILVEIVVVLWTFTAPLQDKWEGIVIVMSPLLYVQFFISRFLYYQILSVISFKM